jgi:hypothetical protein
MRYRTYMRYKRITERTLPAFSLLLLTAAARAQPSDAHVGLGLELPLLTLYGFSAEVSLPGFWL